ncbi:MAG: aspartate 1-decarboxylase [Prevotella sp.]|jgi:aspartate 1-decarboxylase|nr:aspartate 1-decarboxylase [Prevotella sp.]MBQ1649821.1 aspartate 1-decarboxylase [Prevotella sp.]MBQ4041619.1 aspartate 1-decarboxylase [Prevotella sp.]
MNITLLKSKIHRAVVTQADLDYVGSVTIDTNLLREAGIMEYEKVQIVDINNGNRFETYTIAGEEGSGIICLNGAAAKCVNVGDKVIIMAYADMSTEEAATHKPTVLFVNDKNQIVRKANYEKHGLLNDQ